MTQRDGALWGLVGLLLLAACAREPELDLPTLGDWTGEPQVAAKIRTMRRAALEEPRSEWLGRLCMTFHAHDLFNEAIACYGEAARLEPADPRWPYLTAQATAAEDTGGSVHFFEKARELGLEQPALHVRFADGLQRLGRFDEAESHYRRALELEPATTHALLGLAQIQLGSEPEAAARSLEQAVRIAPWHGEVHTLLAQVYERLGRSEEAALELLRAGAYPGATKTPDPLLAAVEAEAVSSLVHRLNGQRLADKGQFVEAEKQFRSVLEIVSNLERDYANLGGALTGQGRFDEAVEQFQKALKINPEDPLTHNNWGMALAGKGDLDGAVRALTRAIEIDPAYADAHRNLGLVSEQQGRQQEALAHYRRALEHNPSLTVAYTDLGTALGRLGRLPQAIEQWRRAIEIDPRELTALFNLANAHILEGQHAQAVEWLRRGIEVAPNSSRIAALLAWELATAPDAGVRNAVEAESLARRVYDAYPQQPQPADGLAAALAALGRFDEAIVIAEGALAKARDSRQGALAAQIESRLAGYRRGEPYRQ